MSKKIIRLTESELKQYIQKIISEQSKKPTGDMTTIGRFGISDAKTLGKRGFVVNGGVATLKSKNVVVKPSQKGWAVYQGGTLKFDLPHDDCDVQLDKLIGYNSLQGGLNEQVSPDSLEMSQIIDILRSKGFTPSKDGGYRFLMIKNSDGPVKGKDGSYVWNYEAYIPLRPGNQLWVGKRRPNSKDPNGLPESSYIVITLTGPTHKILYVNNGKTVKTEDVDTQTAMNYINSYQANF